MLSYPMGSAWKGEATPVFAYVMPRVRRAEPSPTRTLIALRTEQLREVDPAATTKLERAPTDAKGERITLVRYASKKVPRFERVAYVEGERVTWAIILSASSARGLEQWSPFVDAIVRSHRPVVRGER
jgi:RPA family protein